MQRKEQSRDEPIRICASTVKSKFRLSERDLEKLPCLLVPNPHYLSAAPMRLYEEAAVILASIEKEEQARYLEEHKEEIAEAKRAQTKERMTDLANRASVQVSKFQQPKPIPDGNTTLPVEMWVMILDNLQLGYDELYTLLTVAREICTAAITCRDLHNAAQTALQSLAAQQRTTLPEIVDEALKHPARLQLSQLKSVAKELGCMVSGTKPVLIMRILNHCGVDHPTNVPSALLLAAAAEKRSYALYHIPRWLVKRAAARGFLIASCETLFAARKRLQQCFGSCINLLSPDQPEVTFVLTCACGNIPSPKCGHCKFCCVGPCQRHRARRQQPDV